MSTTALRRHEPEKKLHGKSVSSECVIGLKEMHPWFQGLSLPLQYHGWTWQLWMTKLLMRQGCFNGRLGYCTISLRNWIGWPDAADIVLKRTCWRWWLSWHCIRYLKANKFALFLRCMFVLERSLQRKQLWSPVAIFPQQNLICHGVIVFLATTHCVTFHIEGCIPRRMLRLLCNSEATEGSTRWFVMKCTLPIDDPPWNETLWNHTKYVKYESQLVWQHALWPTLLWAEFKLQSMRGTSRPYNPHVQTAQCREEWMPLRGRNLLDEGSSLFEDLWRWKCLKIFRPNSLSSSLFEAPSFISCERAPYEDSGKSTACSWGHFPAMNCKDFGSKYESISSKACCWDQQLNLFLLVLSCASVFFSSDSVSGFFSGLWMGRRIGQGHHFFSFSWSKKASFFIKCLDNNFQKLWFFVTLEKPVCWGCLRPFSCAVQDHDLRQAAHCAWQSQTPPFEAWKPPRFEKNHPGACVHPLEPLMWTYKL